MSRLSQRKILAWAGRVLDPSMEWVDLAIKTYHEQEGRCPSRRSGDASPYIELPLGTWKFGAIDTWLRRRHNTSLSQRCIHLGLAVEPSMELADLAIKTYYEQKGRRPTADSGDASPYIGMPPGTWNFNAINAWLQNRGTTLSKRKALRLECPNE